MNSLDQQSNKETWTSPDLVQESVLDATLQISNTAVDGVDGDQS